jgi:hypothetical protein
MKAAAAPRTPGGGNRMRDAAVSHAAGDPASNLQGCGAGRSLLQVHAVVFDLLDVVDRHIVVLAIGAVATRQLDAIVFDVIDSTKVLAIGVCDFHVLFDAKFLEHAALLLNKYSFNQVRSRSFP